MHVEHAKKKQIQLIIKMFIGSFENLREHLINIFRLHALLFRKLSLDLDTFCNLIRVIG